MRLLAALVLILAAAAPAAAQSKVESFRTTYDSFFDAYMHETVYEFTVPEITGAERLQVANPPEVLVDVYWNSLRVWLINGALECLNFDQTDWIPWGTVTSYNYITSVRATVIAETCRMRLVFFNTARYSNASQKAAVRLNVSSTTGGWMRLTKVSRRDFANFSADSAAGSLSESSNVDLLRSRAAQEALRWER